MLLGPKRNQQLGDMDPQPGGFVEPDVAPGTEGDQELGFVSSWLAVVNHQRASRLADGAAAGVPLQNRFAEPAEAEAGEALAVVAAAAEGAGKSGLAAGAHEDSLPEETLS